MITRTSRKPYKGRCVTLVRVKIQVYPHTNDGNHLEKVDVEVMRLRSVRLPELRCVGSTQSGDTTTRLRARDCPGCKWRDFFEARWWSGRSRR